VRSLPDPIGDEIRRELGRFGEHETLRAVVEAWPDLVGPAIAANAWPARIARDGTLHLHASSSAWAFELTQLAGSILGRLRDELGEAAPAALRFVPGPLPEPAAEYETRAEKAVPEPSQAHRAEAERLAAEIQHPGLREAVARAAAASLAASEAPSADRLV
jgi:hypothetical protein